MFEQYGLSPGGTPFYRSPECMKNEIADSTADVFSFGWIILNCKLFFYLFIKFYIFKFCIFIFYLFIKFCIFIFYLFFFLFLFIL